MAETGSKQKSKGLLIGCLAVAVIVVIALVLLLTKARKFNVVDYITPTAAGVDGRGELNLTFDTDKLIADIELKKSLSDDDKSAIASALEDFQSSCKASAESGLSNGDTVTIETSLDSKLLKSFRAALVNGTVTYTVDGLYAPQEMSLNDYLSVSVTGFEGFGTAWPVFDKEGFSAEVLALLENNIAPEEAEAFVSTELAAYEESVKAVLSQTDNLVNGDTVDVILSMDQPEIEQYGITFNYADFSCTVEGLTDTVCLNIADYLDASFIGADGAGSVNLSVNTEALTSDLAAVFRESGRGQTGALSAEDAGYSLPLPAPQEEIAPTDETEMDELALGSETEADLEYIAADMTEAESEAFALGNETELDAEYIAAESELTAFGNETELDAEYIAAAMTEAESEISALGNETELDGEYIADAMTEAEELLSAVMTEAEEKTGNADFVNATETEAFLAPANETELDAAYIAADMTEAESEISALGNETELDAEYIVTDATEAESEACALGNETEMDEEYISSGAEGETAPEAEEAAEDTEADLVTVEPIFVVPSGIVDESAPDGYTEAAAAVAEEISQLWSYRFDTSISGEALHNGDLVTVTCVPSANGDYEYLSDVGVFLIGGEKSYTVEGLGEPEQIDLTDAVDVTFTGTCPNVYVNFAVDRSLPYVAYTSLEGLIDSEPIQAYNGDLYTLNVTYDEAALAAQGYAVAGSTRDYEISGLASYQISAETVDDENLQAASASLKALVLPDLIRDREKVIAAIEDVDTRLNIMNAEVSLGKVISTVVSDENGTNSRVFLAFKAAIPEVQQNMTEIEKDAWYMAVFDGVVQAADGTITLPDVDGDPLVLYTDEEALQAAIDAANAELGENITVKTIG